MRDRFFPPLPVLSSRFLSGVILLALANFVLRVALDPGLQWDFRVYHSAPTALTNGMNPYGTGGGGFDYRGLAFLYPPITLYVLEPLTLLSYRSGLLAFLTLKLAALAALLIVWHRNFEPLSPAWPTVLFLAYAFNAPILKDIEAGNIAVFEQLGLWLAFAFMLRDRPYMAGAILAVIAQFKLMPILFLGLLLIAYPQPRWKPFWISLGLFVVLLASNAVLLPDMTRQFIDMFGANVPHLDERGSINPSSLALVRDATDELTRLGFPVGRTAANLTFVAIIGLIGAPAMWLVWARQDVVRRDPKWAIYVACTIFAIATPRMKDYSYILLLIPALHVAQGFLDGKLSHASLFPLVLLVALPYIGFIRGLVPYIPLLSAWFLLYYLVRLRLDEIWPQPGKTEPLPDFSHPQQSAKT